MDRLNSVLADDGRRWTVVASAAVGVHLITGIAHGAVHDTMPVRLPQWQAAIVVPAVFLGPLVGAGLVAIGRRRAGGALVGVWCGAGADEL